MRRHGGTLAAALVAAVVCSGGSCKHGDSAAEPETPPVHVHCAPAVRTTLHEVRTVRGTVIAAPDHDATVAPQIPGRLLRVAVREGDPVTAGAILAEVESQQVADALLQARAQLAQTNAALHNAQIANERLQHLFERGIAARQEVDDAAARRAEAEATVASARAAVDLAERNRERATLRSPIAGVVIRVVRRAGELVDGTPATPVVEVADPNALEFLGSAAPADLVRLSAGQSATVRFDALPGQNFRASVRSVAPSVDPTSGVGSVRLTLLIDSVRPPFGLFGTAAVDVGNRADVLVVPESAVRNAPSGGAEVVVCDGDHARARAVMLGTRQDGLAEVREGLSPGDRVVTQGALGLADGAAIVVVPGDAGT